MKIKIAAIVDVGRERENNEDAYIVCSDLTMQNWSLDSSTSFVPQNKYGSVIVVADGMGGANAGEVASAIAIKAIEATFSAVNVKHYYDSKDISGLLNLSVKNADEAINKRICEDPDTLGMGTTIVICWIVDQVAHVAWCGDSRCYVYNPFKGLKQLTKDHSYVQELVDKGEISEKEAIHHPDNNVITKGLGDVNSQPSPDIVSYNIIPNDILLLCSDGLCGYCTFNEIRKVLQLNYMNLIVCRDKLLELALKSGGSDNICIALASLIDVEQNSPAPMTLVQKIKMYIKQLLQ